MFIKLYFFKRYQHKKIQSTSLIIIQLYPCQIKHYFLPHLPQSIYILSLFSISANLLSWFFCCTTLRKLLYNKLFIPNSSNNHVFPALFSDMVRFVSFWKSVFSLNISLQEMKDHMIRLKAIKAAAHFIPYMPIHTNQHKPLKDYLTSCKQKNKAPKLYLEVLLNF